MTNAGTFLRRGLTLAVLLASTAVARAQAPDRLQADPEYLKWLEERPMLFQARTLAASLSANSAQWKHRYGEPQPREVVKAAPVWLLDYPGSVIVRPGESVIATWADPERWQALQE